MADNFMWQMIEFLFSLFESILLFNFLTNILSKKISPFFYKTGITGYAAIVYWMTGAIPFSNLKLAAAILVFLVFSVIMFKGTVKKKIIVTVAAFILLVLCDIVVANVLGIVMKVNLMEVIFAEKWFRVLLFCTSKLIFFILLRTIGYLMGSSKLDLPVKYWYMITGIFMISLIVLLLIGEIGVLTHDYPNKSVYFVIVSFGVLVINIFMHDILIQLSENHEKEQLYKIIDIKNEMQNKYYVEREQVYKETRRLGHDFKNHMLCVSALLGNGKLEEAKKYLDKISEAQSSCAGFVKSGNDIMDAVLNQKIEMARKANIDIDVAADAPENIRIKSVDLCAILGNLIDNAIEASVKIADETRRKINIKINPYKDYLLVTVSNNVGSNEKIDVRKLRTTKADSRNHGLGTKIVRNAVEKYDGAIEYNYYDDIFAVKILIKLEE